MTSQILPFLDKVEEIANNLQEQDIVEFIKVIRDHTNTSQLSVLIVGSIGSGRASLANVLLEQPKLLPVSPIPKMPISINIGYGDSVTTEAILRDGTRMSIPLDLLRSFLTSDDTDNMNKYLSVEVKTNCDLLKTSELRIESIEVKRSLTEWKELLAISDYVLLVLNASALLSEQEKLFIRDILNPGFGLERTAIVINRIDSIPEDEYVSTPELVRAYLGTLGKQPPLIEFSALQAANGMIAGNIPPKSGYHALINLVKNDLPEKHDDLRVATVCQAIEICLTEVEKAVERQIYLLSTSEASLQQLLRKFDLQSNQLQDRTQKSQRKIEIYINTLLKEEFFREIEGFNNAVRQQLLDEVMSVESLTQIKRYLPGYLEALWVEFFNSQLASIRGKLVTEMQLINETVKDDLKDLLGDETLNLQAFLSNFNPAPEEIRTFLMPRRKRSQASSTATSFQLAGLLLLFSNLPLALASFGTGELIRVLSKRSADIADKQAIVASAIDGFTELEPQIKQSVNDQFAELTEELKKAIAEVYTQGVAQIRLSLEANIERRKDLEVKQEQLANLCNVTLPELRQVLSQIYKP